MRKNVSQKRSSVYRKVVAAALATVSLSAASAYAGPDTISTFSAGTALDSASDWSTNAIPGINNDALIGTTFPTAALTTSLATNVSFGSLDVTSSFNINMTGATGGSAKVILVTLGAGGVDANGNLNNSNTVSGAAPNDLIYVVSGGLFKQNAGSASTFNASIAVASPGNFDAAGTGQIAINSGMYGSSTITKTGTGIFNISTGNNNNFTGGYIVNAGTLMVSSASSLGATPGTATVQLTFSGSSTLQITSASSTIGATRLFNISTGAVATIDTLTNAVTAFNVISGGGSLAKVGTGSLLLVASPTYTGSTNVSGGLLVLNTSTNIPSTPLILGGGTFQLSSGYAVNQTVPTLILAANTSSKVVTSTFASSSLSLALGAINHSTGSFVDFTLPTGGGSITTTTANTAIPGGGTGGIIGGYATVNGQTGWASSAGTGTTPGAITALTTYDTGFNTTGADVDVTSASNLTPTISVVDSLRFNTGSSLTIAPAGNLTIASGGILETSNVGTTANGITGGNLTTNGSDLTLIQTTNAPFTINSNIVDASPTSPIGLVKTGPGTLLLGGVDTFTGPTNLYGGTITLLNQYALQYSTVISNVSGTSLVFDSSVTSHAFVLGGLNTASNLALQDNGGNPITLTFGSSNVSTIIAGNISGGGSLIKVGTGLTQLRGTSSFTGGVTINGGTLQFVNAALGTSPFPITVDDGGTFYYSTSGTATFASSRSINLGAGNVSIQSGGTTNGTNTSGTSLFVIGASGNTGGALIGPNTGVANLIKTGLGTLQINTNSSYTGSTTVEAGILAVDSSNALGTSTLGGSYTGSGPLIINSPAGFYSQANFQTSSASIASLSSVLAGNASTGINSLVLGVPTVGGTTALTIGADGTSTTYSGNITDLNASFTGALGTIIKTGNGTLTLSGTNSYAGGTNVSGGTLALSNSTALPAKSDLIIGSGATVFAANSGTGTYALNLNTLTNTGLLDLGKNAAVIHTGTTPGALFTEIQQTFNGGAWNGGSGITSSVAAADSSHLTAIGFLINDDGSGNPLYGAASGGLGSTFEGVTPVDNDLLVKFTYYGDANLDGKVDGSDYSRIDSSFGTSATGWYNGDFNYDGVINGSDYTLIDNAFNAQGTRLSASIASPLATSTAEIAAVASVPEPAVIGLLAFGAVGLLGSRRRRK